MSCISVVIPCFNGARTLGGTIQSALKQDEVDCGIIVVDDGSTDTSVAIARSYIPDVQVLTGPNRGVSAVRNEGIAATKSDWILFLDADDLLKPGTLRRRLDTAQQASADVVICDWEEFGDDDNQPLEQSRIRSIDWRAIEADAEIACATHAWATTSAILYRRSTVERIGGFREDLPIIQDARFLFDAAFIGAQFAHSKHVGACYRVLPGSLSRRRPGEFWSDVLHNGKQIEALWRMRGTLSGNQVTALEGIYNHAARGLFAAQDQRYFDAVAAQRSLGRLLPRHSRVLEPVARRLGLNTARKLASLVDRV